MHAQIKRTVEEKEAALLTLMPRPALFITDIDGSNPVNAIG